MHVVLGMAVGWEAELDCVADGTTLKWGRAVVTVVVITVAVEDEELERLSRAGIPCCCGHKKAPVQVMIFKVS